MKDTEIVVIGGGIAGASATYHLAAHGRRVTLLERGEIASGASGVNAGAIDSIGWGDRPDLQAHLTAGSLEIFKRVQLDLGRTSSSGSRARSRRSTRRSSTRSRASACRRCGREATGSSS
jgi:glycine/D-amino acid oxidase-like deaminating enzyme